MHQQKQALVLVGRITSVFGIKGWVNVYSYTDPAENILDFSEWLLSPSEGDGQGKRQSIPELKDCQPIKLSRGQRSGKKIIAQLADSQTPEEAARFVRHDVFVRREELPELEEGYYWIDLEGLQVVNLQGQVLGKVSRMMETGANDVMVVLAENGEENLIPYVEGRYVLDVNLEDSLIKVDWETLEDD